MGQSRPQKQWTASDDGYGNSVASFVVVIIEVRSGNDHDVLCWRSVQMEPHCNASVRPDCKMIPKRDHLFGRTRVTRPFSPRRGLTSQPRATPWVTLPRSLRVGVGMLIAGHPLHRSGRAELPHPAPVLGHNRKSLAQSIPGVWMTDSRVWYPAFVRSGKPLPCNS